ncbi:MAG TPA: phenylacetate--CoA ligase, partial [Blastocatellia bacterium]|nr:phenylacetate--CoA ligase [Blastocatellia bacterium]
MQDPLRNLPKCWEPAIECASRDRLRDLQQSFFAATLDRTRGVQFYRSRLEERGLDPASMTLDDLPRLGFTTKDDLRTGYPFGFLACDSGDLLEVHGSSGTTGKPVIVGYTASDLQTWKTVMARTMAASGVTRADVIQNAYGYGLFTGGLGFHYGAREIGANVIPVSAGRTDLQLLMAEDLGATVLCCTPSFALYLAGEA